MELLERETELSRLRKLIDEVAVGSGVCVLVEGEAGIGKTALVQAALKDPLVPLEVLTSTCEALHTPRPLGPFVDMSTNLPDHLVELLHAGRVDNGLFPAFLDYLKRVETPIAIVIEDLHWADGATLDLFKYLSRRIQDIAVVVIGTYRSDELMPGHALMSVVGEIPATTSVRLKLAPLSEETVATLARAAGRPARELFEVTCGNPFFLTEVLADTPGGGVPASVRDAVLGRLARLSDAARSISEWVSIVPTRMERELFDQICGDTESLDECTTRGVLTVVNGYVAYRHELARQAVNDALPSSRRARMNAVVFDYLRSDDRTAPARLVHHAVQAGLSAAIRELGPAAAKAARATGAHRESASLLNLILESCPSLEPAERAGYLEDYANECALVEEGLVAGREASVEALELYRRLGDRPSEGRALVAMAYYGANLEEKLTAANAAIEILEALPPGPDLVSAYTIMAFNHMLTDAEIARRWGQKAVSLAEQLDDPASMGRALNALATIELGREYNNETLALWERGLALAMEHRAGVDIASAFTNLMTRSLLARDYSTLFDCADRSITYFRDHDIDGWIGGVINRRARGLIEVGRWEEADHALDGLAREPALRDEQKHFGGVLRALLEMRRNGPNLEFWPDAITGMSEMRPAGIAAYWAEAAWLASDTDKIVEVVGRHLEGAIASREPWLIGALLVWLHRAGRRPPQVDVLLPSAIVSEIEGDHAAAAASWAELGCRYDQALSLMNGDMAQVLEAIAILDALGAKPAASIARRRIKSIGGHAPRGPYISARTDPLGLTKRERQVFDLLVEGLTNQEIGERLHRSTRTVEHHAGAIYRKLNVGSRTELILRARSATKTPDEN